ncbi:hypothetical protein [Paenibacillus puldeungensis]
MPTRRYVKAKLSIDQLFQRMNEDNIRYVILRWFEQLPDIQNGEDIDLLVHDEDINKLHYFTKEKVGDAVPCDVYSASGLEGSDYAKLPYYPVRIAETILQNRVLWKGKYYVPCQMDLFLSMAYHVVYHKGERSGIPVIGNNKLPTKPLEHNYHQVLKDLAHINDVQVEISLSSLHRYLVDRQWSPGIDTIRKLGLRNKWLKALYPPKTIDQIRDGELIVYFVREWAYSRGLTDLIVNTLEKMGLNILLTHRLNETARYRASKKIRGGNWGKGPWKVCGGGPEVLIAAYDLEPIAVPESKRNEYPFVANGHFFLKEKIRKELMRDIPRESKTNPLHSSDDEQEAWEYIKIACPEMVSHVKKRIQTHMNSYLTREPVLQKLTGNNTRGKVEVIEFNGKKVVKKTFKPGRQRFLEREKYAFEVLSKKTSLIPTLLDQGENYIIIPYYDKLIEDQASRVSLLKNHLGELGRFLKLLYDEGLAHMDFHPGNILFTANKGIKIIDFEFLYKYKKKPGTFRESYDIAGIPPDFDGDLPIGIRPDEKKLHDIWMQTSGYGLEDLALSIEK